MAGTPSAKKSKPSRDAKRTPQNRDNVAENMTSNQIAEAQKMARWMVEANPKVMGK